MVPESHPLQELFTELIHHHFDRDVGLRDAEVQDYIANILSEFCECEQLFKIRNANERPLNDVGEMLLEADPIYGPAPSFAKEGDSQRLTFGSLEPLATLMEQTPADDLLRIVAERVKNGADLK